MNRWNDESFLDVVEELSEWENMISSEDEMSEEFDEYLDDHCDTEKMTPTDIRCAFADWVDMMTRDGAIHPEQADNYGYVGEHDIDD